jgi:pimeloyl-ACP methyl ester carboxylesterase
METSGGTPDLVHNFATAPDGGKLSYYTVGSGPDLLVLHGSATFALLHEELAVALSPYYTVHLASRRGRGRSSPYPQPVLELPTHCESHSLSTNTDGPPAQPASPPNPNAILQIGSTSFTRTYNPAFAAAVIATEVSDIETLVAATQAEYILGVSSGGLITLQTLLKTPRSPSLSSLRKVAIMEPPAFFADRATTCRIGDLPRFERELVSGDMAGAAVTAMRVVELGPTWIPRWMMKALAKMMFRGQEGDVAKRKALGEEDRGVCTMAGLTPLLRYEFALVEGMVGEAERFSALRSIEAEGGSGVDIMFLSGGKSPAWIKEGTAVLVKAMAGVKTVVIEGVGHELTCNAEMRGQPAKAVPALREFFR